jgi:rfaE bifunctional protein nucleotidyltransferase chain/domain
VPQDDRAAVLGALACVDAVVVFDDDTPEQALAELCPDVWAKGGDYAPDELPESATVEAAGGRVAILPFVTGRSTTRLIEEAALRAGR